MRKEKNYKKLAKTVAIAAAAIVMAATAVFTSACGSDSGSDRKRSQAESTATSSGKTGGSDDGGKESNGQQTLMIYMIGSDLESEGGLATADLEEIIDADRADNLNIVIQSGGCKNWQNDYMENGKVQRFAVEGDKLTELDNLGKISMSKTETLTDFVEFAEDEYPADDYVLILWDHGGGIPIGYGKDENFPDDNFDDYMIGEALDEAGVHFDSIVFDACNMCTLEIAMALQDNTDYLIGAESYVNGTGLEYTNWISSLSDNPISDGDYRETIVTDYMSDCRSKGKIASMSVIAMSKVDAVYDAYVDFVKQAYADLYSGKYAEYTQARSSCGLYEYTDSVDLVTLATKYENDYSTPLINAVVNAVDYIDSDLSFGHGITAYSPSNYTEYYDMGRESFGKLDYDDNIIEFYDAYATLSLAYYYGTTEALAYTGDWYDSDIVSYYNGDSSSQDVQAAQEYSIDTTEIGGNTVVALSDSDWEILNHVYCDLYIATDDSHYVYLGYDLFGKYDDDWNLIIQNPTNWTYINDHIATYISVDSYSDSETDEWYQMGTVSAQVNGEDAMLLVYFSNENPSGTILGYTPYNFETNTPEAEGYYYLNSNDVINLVYVSYNTSTGKIDDYYTITGNEFYYKDAVVSYKSVDLSSDNTIICYTLEDVYGNTYETEAMSVVGGVIQK